MTKSLFELLKEVDVTEKDGNVPTERRPYDMKCVALVAKNKRGGSLVSIKPYCALWWELDDMGSVDLGDYGLDDAPEGISIWEGMAIWQPGGYECPEDGMMNYEGTFRRLTAEEAAKMQAGEPLWTEPEEDDVDEDEGTEEQGNVSPVRDGVR